MTELELLRKEYDQLNSRHNLLLERLARHFSNPIWSVESLGLSSDDIVKAGLYNEDGLYGMFPFQTSDPKPSSIQFVPSVPDEPERPVRKVPGEEGMDDKRVIDLAHECELFDDQHYGSLWADRIRLFAVAIEVETEQREREACAAICDELESFWHAKKDVALLNGDVDLSNASSGEPRAARAIAAAIAAAIRARGKQ